MKTILIQLDTDPQPSVFDRVVAVDAGADEVFSYGGITADAVEPLVHGAMFTRGPAELRNSAIFVGGSDVVAGEEVYQRVLKAFFGPLRVSVMMDSNGSNTTAAAAVLLARKHVDLEGVQALVLGGTGPVGQRAAQLLARAGARVFVGSRSAERAAKVCESIRALVPQATVTAVAVDAGAPWPAECKGAQLLIAAGAAGARLVSKQQLKTLTSLKVAIDLNAVPPAGIEGVEVADKNSDRDGAICYGAIGVGGTKMKIHKAALKGLFAANDRLLDTRAIYAVGEEIVGR